MRVSDRVLAVIGGAEVDEGKVVLAQQLDRKLYLEVAKVLEEVGARWDRKAKAHLFERADGQERLDVLVATGDVSTRAEIGFFETPPAVIFELIELAGLARMVGQRPYRVLEPSAGGGRIARELAALRCHVCAVEKDPAVYGRLLAALGLGSEASDVEESFLVHRRFRNALGCAAYRGDFLEVADYLERVDYLELGARGDGGGAGYFDAVVMNPPFARRQDVQHVLRAYRLLAPGGVLVSVVSAGVEFRRDRATTELRALLHEVGGEVLPVPDGAFRESGTDVRTRIVRLPRPA